VNWIREELANLQAIDRLRELRSLTPLDARRVLLEGREVRVFCGNDYLGLSQHPDVRAAAAAASQAHGMGPRGSALICGYTEEHRLLERDLAALKGASDALVFPTGFAANMGVLTALGGEDTAFFSDALNHASIIDGCRLARGDVSVYAHGDTADLDRLLSASTAARKIIVTDTVFSMEGTLAPLESIVALKRQHGAVLVIDEAHATLVHGAEGGGVAEAAGVAGEVEFQVGTLSKAVGALGGYVATSSEARSWLLNVARSYVFSTALPLPVVAAAREALAVVRRTPQIRRDLQDRIAQLSEGLGMALDSPIASIVLGTEERALQASASLLEAGLLVPAIRPPTVPPESARLRIALSAAHTQDDVADLLAALAAIS
jgi:8-amino-7-oxononanoate synthase